MNNKFLYVFLFIIVSIISGCSEYKKNIKEAKNNKQKHPEQRIFDGEIEPEFPDEDENEDTILGVDVNKNGIRDDVDIWINYVGINRNHRMGLRQFAKAQNKRLIVGSTYSDSQVIDQAAKDVWDGFLCSSYFTRGKFNGKSPSSMMLELVVNTSQRVDAYKSFNRGSVMYESTIKHLNTIEAYRACNFKLEAPY